MKLRKHYTGYSSGRLQLKRKVTNLQQRRHMKCLEYLCNTVITHNSTFRFYCFKLYNSIHTETWPVRKENEVALQRAETRMVRQMCDVKVKDKVKVPSKELRGRLGMMI